MDISSPKPGDQRLNYDVLGVITEYLGDDAMTVDIFNLCTEFFFAVIVRKNPVGALTPRQLYYGGGDNGALQALQDSQNPGMVPTEWLTEVLQSPHVSSQLRHDIMQFIMWTKSLYCHVFTSLGPRRPEYDKYYVNGKPFTAADVVKMHVTHDQLLHFVKGMLMLLKTLYQCLSGDFGYILQDESVGCVIRFFPIISHGPKGEPKIWLRMAYENAYMRTFVYNKPGREEVVVDGKKIIRAYARGLMSFQLQLKQNETRINLLLQIRVPISHSAKDTEEANEHEDRALHLM
jgi:hypothetical protein